MQVILLQDVRNLGKKHEVKNVSEGYARNFLFPQKSAKLATPQALAELSRLKEKIAQINQESDKKMSELARLLLDRSLEFPIKVNDAGLAFGSITKEDILKALRDTGLVGKERINLTLEHPLKEIGEHVVKVKLHNGQEVSLKIKLLPLE